MSMSAPSRERIDVRALEIEAIFALSSGTAPCLFASDSRLLAVEEKEDDKDEDDDLDEDDDEDWEDEDEGEEEDEEEDDLGWDDDDEEDDEDEVEEVVE